MSFELDSVTRILGLDLGERRIGVAVSDALGMTAQGICTIDRRSPGSWLEKLDELVTAYQIQAIVIGLPRNMDGSLGQKGEQSIQIADDLKERYAFPIHLWDERLSTAAVERTLIEADMSRKKRKRVVDQLAATWILQGFLDAQRR